MKLHEQDGSPIYVMPPSGVLSLLTALGGPDPDVGVYIDVGGYMPSKTPGSAIMGPFYLSEPNVKMLTDLMEGWPEG